jgi:hypothetical protein
MANGTVVRVLAVAVALAAVVTACSGGTLASPTRPPTPAPGAARYRIPNGAR